MKIAPILILILTIFTSGCASLGGANLPGCDGKHLRPANLHGSVLAPAAPTTSPPGPDGLADSAAYRGCGR